MINIYALINIYIYIYIGEGVKIIFSRDKILLEKIKYLLKNYFNHFIYIKNKNYYQNLLHKFRLTYKEFLFIQLLKYA